MVVRSAVPSVAVTAAVPPVAGAELRHS